MMIIWKKLSRVVGAFARVRRGNVAITFAFALIPLMAAVGAAVDYSRGSSDKTAMQGALDATSLALVNNAGTMTSSALTSSATSMFAANFNRPEAGNIQVAAAFDSTTATLTLNGSAAVPATFMGIFGVNSMNISALSKARGTSGASACVIALDSSSDKSFYASGGGTVKVPNCGLYVNSSAGDALAQEGTGSITAQSISVVGTAESGGHYSPTPKINQKVIADPLINIAEPTVPSSCTYTKKTFSSAVTLPGGSVYCDDTKFNANITFGAGIHYFKSAKVTTANNISITGTDVMLYFINSQWDSTGTGTVSLSSMQSGTYAGIAMFGSRSDTNLNDFSLTGNKDYFINGTVYLPKSRLNLYGSADLTVTSKSGYVIAQRFNYQGNSSFTFDAFGGAAPSALAPSRTFLMQ